MPRTMVALESRGVTESLAQAGSFSYAPYEALLDQTPVAGTPLPMYAPGDPGADIRAIRDRPDARLMFTPQRPIAHFRRDLEYREVRLADYVVPLPRTELRVAP